MSELVNYSTGVTVPAAWLNHAQLREEGLASYVVYQAGGTTYAKALSPAGIDFSNADSATTIQNALTALSSGGRIYLRNGTYTCNSQLSSSANNLEIYAETGATLRSTIDLDLLTLSGNNNKVKGLIFDTAIARTAG